MSLSSSVLVARNRDQFQDCTFETCDLSTSFWYYRPSLEANFGLLSLFSISLLAYLTTFIATRRATAFTLALSAGCALEVAGYIGRIMAWWNPWHDTGFLIQIICLTIAPAFMAGGIYLCLRRIVYAFGKENSRVKPETYTRLFIPCDVVSLVLQAWGGGESSVAAHDGRSTTMGDNIMLAGLAFQAFTLVIFMGLCADFAIRTIRRYREMDGASLDPKFAALRSSTKFRGFLVALGIATLCIFIRSVYRVAELSQGWTGSLIRDQWLFVGLEGIMVVVAVLVLNVFHPALCFKEGVEGEGGFIGVWGFKGKRQNKTENGQAEK